ncbi:MAG: protein-disulfide reductase DsbD [Methylococcales bacterium]|nr:protein-disulfide reductase DsbD [Methylococcales bacterium]
MKHAATASLLLLAFILTGCQEEQSTPMEEKVLTVEQAFPLTIHNTNQQITARWDSAPEVFLYADKTTIKSLTPGVTVTLNTPATTTKKDPNTLQPVNIYRGITTLTAQIHAAAHIQQASFAIHYQGCADRGLCYPPQTINESITFNNSQPTQPADDFSNLLGNPIKSITQGRSTPLPGDEAFALNVTANEGNTVFAEWTIAEDYYLYKDKIRIQSKTPGITVGEITFPDSTIKDDPEFGATPVYTHSFSLDIPLNISTQQQQVTLILDYQGCAEVLGICYTPQHKTVTLDLINPSINAEPTPLATSSNDSAVLSEQDAFYQTLSNSSFISVMAAFFVAGLFLSLTPCVYPMLPILSGIIAGQDNPTPRKSLILISIYILSVSLVYAIAGVFAALAGANLQAIFQDPWIIGSFSLVFVLLSLSMFGFYELRLPSRMQNKLNNISSSQQGGTLIGTAIMGAISALVVSPCVTAPMFGALFFISETGDAILGGFALFSLSIGMSGPLFLLGVTEGSLLPKADHWMNSIKSIFGVLMLAVAIWLLSRVIPAPVTLALWGLLLIGSSVYLHAVDPLPGEASGWQRLWKGLGIATLVYGVILLIGAASGQKDPLAPLKPLIGQTAVAQSMRPTFQTVSTLPAFKTALAQAKAKNLPAIVDIYADWCAECKRLDLTTFSDNKVRSVLSQFKTIKLDITKPNDELNTYLSTLGPIAPPTQLFFSKSGVEQRQHRVIGYQDPQTFLSTLQRVQSR